MSLALAPLTSLQQGMLLHTLLEPLVGDSQLFRCHAQRGVSLLELGIDTAELIPLQLELGDQRGVSE